MPSSNQPATRGDLQELRAELRAEIRSAEARMTAHTAETVGAAEARMTAHTAEAVGAAEARMTAHTAEAVGAAEARMTAHTAEAVGAAEGRILQELRAVEERMLREIAAAAAHTANVVLEHNRELFRIATDQTRAVADRGDAVERRVEAHVADDTRHRVARRRR
jgi:hypothetical protein